MELKQKRQSLVKHLGELLELEKKKEVFGQKAIKNLDCKSPSDNSGKTSPPEMTASFLV